MSSIQGINQLKNFIANEGIQDTSRYAVQIGNYVFNEQVLAVDLPGPKYEFLNINYWQGNPFFRMPIGVKFEDSVVIQLLVPELLNSEFFNFLSEYTNDSFFTSNGGSFFYGNGSSSSLGSFAWKRNYEGLRIVIGAYSRTSDTLDSPNRIYAYNNCFLEKILPLRFEAGKAEPQSISLSFVVGTMDGTY
jgi:hypothetical protein